MRTGLLDGRADVGLLMRREVAPNAAPEAAQGWAGIVDRSKGDQGARRDIDVHNEPGKGCMFVLEVPAAAEAAAPIALGEPAF